MQTKAWQLPFFPHFSSLGITLSHKHVLYKEADSLPGLPGLHCSLMLEAVSQSSYHTCSLLRILKVTSLQKPPGHGNHATLVLQVLDSLDSSHTRQRRCIAEAQRRGQKHLLHCDGSLCQEWTRQGPTGAQRLSKYDRLLPSDTLLGQLRVL